MTARFTITPGASDIFAYGRLYRAHANGKKFYKAFTFLVRPAQWLHWLEMDTPMWTLIFRGPRERKWGFLVDGKWCWWRQHN
jgi:hypothetical protein